MNEDNPIISRQEYKSRFRELQPEDFWGGYISLENVMEGDFESTISQLASELQFTYSGYRISSEREKPEYHFTRYPRRKFGPVAPIEQYRNALTKLGEKLQSRTEEEQKRKAPTLRVLLGMQEGYDKNNRLHTIQEVDEELGDNVKTKSVEIYSIGPWGKYTEPAVIIECDPSNIARVYALAEKFHQERFTIEDLYTGKSHVVETQYCTSPDEK